MTRSVISNSTEARIVKSTSHSSFHWSTTSWFSGNDFNSSKIFVIKWLPATKTLSALEWATTKTSVLKNTQNFSQSKFWYNKMKRATVNGWTDRDANIELPPRDWKRNDSENKSRNDKNNLQDDKKTINVENVRQRSELSNQLPKWLIGRIFAYDRGEGESR